MWAEPWNVCQVIRWVNSDCSNTSCHRVSPMNGNIIFAFTYPDLIFTYMAPFHSSFAVPHDPYQTGEEKHCWKFWFTFTFLLFQSWVDSNKEGNLYPVGPISTDLIASALLLFGEHGTPLPQSWPWSPGATSKPFKNGEWLYRSVYGTDIAKMQPDGSAWVLYFSWIWQNTPGHNLCHFLGSPWIYLSIFTWKCCNLLSHHPEPNQVFPKHFSYFNTLL